MVAVAAAGVEAIRGFFWSHGDTTRICGGGGELATSVTTAQLRALINRSPSSTIENSVD